MTISKAIKQVAEYLESKFIEDRYVLQYKSTTDPEEFEVGSPDIFCFTMPSSAIIDNYPARCPSICITLDGRSDYTYDVTAHICLSSSSQSEKEIANPTEQKGVYEVGEGEGYTTESDNDLIVESILFTDQVYNYIMNYTDLNVSEVTIEYPDVSLPDFPYAISSVSFKLDLNITHNGQNPFNHLY